MTFSVMNFHWYQYWSHVILITLSMSSLFMGWRQLKQAWHDSLVMYCCRDQGKIPRHWRHCNGTINDWNKVWHDFFGLLMPVLTPLALALASCNIHGVINGIIAFLKSRWSKWNARRLFYLCDIIGISIIWHQWHITLMLTLVIGLALKVV